jgi:prepilin peptidase CpaA
VIPVSSNIILLLAALMISVATDARHGKVYNVVTVPVAFFGMLIAAIEYGAPGLSDSILGFFMGLALFLPLWLFRVVGGGDVKLLASIGACLGWRMTCETAFTSIVVGALMGIIWLAMTGRLRNALYSIVRFFQSVLLPKMKLETIPVEQCHRMPFAPAIAIASILVLSGLRILEYQGYLQ